MILVTRFVLAVVAVMSTQASETRAESMAMDPAMAIANQNRPLNPAQLKQIARIGNYIFHAQQKIDVHADESRELDELRKSIDALISTEQAASNSIASHESDFIAASVNRSQKTLHSLRQAIKRNREAADASQRDDNTTASTIQSHRSEAFSRAATQLEAALKSAPGDQLRKLEALREALQTTHGATRNKQSLSVDQVPTLQRFTKFAVPIEVIE